MPKTLTEQQVKRLLQKLNDGWPQELMLFVHCGAGNSTTYLCQRDRLHTPPHEALNSAAILAAYGGRHGGIVADGGDPNWSNEDA